jgi:GMP synthase-like glutamine amidotransferase
MNRRVHVLQHVWFEGPGWIREWARERGHDLRVCRVDEGDILPRESEIDFLIVLGGPMSVHDARPWLEGERALMREILAGSKPLLGICLGGQLLTQILGGEVTRAANPEIGWYDVTLNPSKFFADPVIATFHWHGEVFSLPAGAESLGRSQLTPVQGYVFGDNKVALQFHPEADYEGVKLMVRECMSEICESIGDEILALAEKNCPGHKRIAYRLLDRMLG